MTVYAHINTLRAESDTGFYANFTEKSVDVWFVVVYQSLSNKTADEVRELLNIDKNGIWITTPFKNNFWVVTNNINGFDVQEFKSADLSDIYNKLEIDAMLSQKADIQHQHLPKDIEGLEIVISDNIDESMRDVNNFIDKLAQALKYS